MFRPWEDNIAKLDNGEGNMSKTVNNDFYMEKGMNKKNNKIK